MLLTIAVSMTSNAANGIIGTFNQKICEGDEVTIGSRLMHVFSDTIVRDTIRGLDPSKDSILVYMVNVYPSFLNEQQRMLSRGSSFSWFGMTIDHAGTYEKKFQTVVSSCDSIYRLVVREYTENQVVSTLCQGSSMTFGHLTLTETGVYRDTFHYSQYDSIVILTLNVVKPDTTIKTSRIPEGFSTTWNGKTYSEAGIYDTVMPNRFGCDSLSRLVLTTYHVDTLDTTVVLCPAETITWHGRTFGQTGDYEFPGVRANGDYVYYKLHLTVKELIEKEQQFTICDDETVSFNGKIYANAGTFFDYLACDTLYRIIINKPPTQLHLQTGELDAIHPYYWQYQLDGETKTDTITAPGVYEHITPNPETGCNDIWRLVLTQDTTTYHFEETVTVCENEPFSWHGKDNLNRQGIGQTSHYFDNYKTQAGNDSIYELILTVIPLKRSIQTITFCGETTWKGQVLTNSTIVYDTVAASSGCDSIIRINFDKVTPFYRHDTATIIQGETLLWHGQAISGEGFYIDAHQNQYGCDSTYTLGVGVDAATPQTNMLTTQYSICDGDSYEWRGTVYHPTTTTTYIDTIYKSGTQEIDSIYVLKLTVHTTYKDTVVQHLYTCGGAGASIRYQGKDYYQDTTIISDLRTVYGCDSIVKVFLHFNTALYLTDTVEIADIELPYTWTYRLPSEKTDTVLTKAGTYDHRTKAEGTCTNHEQLVLIVYPTYLYQQDTTICELDLPFHWQNGPTEHINDDLQHTAGTTKQYEYHYLTVNNTDSIYRLNLTIDEVPKVTEQYSVCEGYPQWIRGKEYGTPGMTLDVLYRDTVYPYAPGTICDSVVYVEVYVSAAKKQTQVVVLHPGESIDWGHYHITSGGVYHDTIKNIGPHGCDSISTLRVIQELVEERYICSNDTSADTHHDKKYPYIWERPYAGSTPITLYTSGTYRDTVFDGSGYIESIYRMDLTVVQPYDTTVVIHGCQNKGAIWRGQKYEQDTVFIDRVEVIPHTHEQPCDSVFHVTIKIDTIYKIRIDTTLCEYQLPFIVGRTHQDTIWQEGNFRHAVDSTSCGCDSIIEGHLTIIPKLTHNDSTFICEDDIKKHPVWLGDTISPAFINNDGGKWADKWQGKWHGVKYTSDTIVWDCGHNYFHHIIVRPSQKIVKDTTFFLCPDDSIRIFWGRGDDTTWFYKDTLYEEHTPMPSSWTDNKHHYSYANDAYSCDSITRWHITVLPRIHKDTTAHRLLGDSIWWGGGWRYYTGVYDSIGPSKDTSSLGDTCSYIYALHLIVDTAYYFRDTVDLCTFAKKTHTWIWPETGYKQTFTVGTKDTIAHHFVDSLITYDRRDSIYDLCVNYRIHRDTLIFDTICEGTYRRFDSHHRDNTVTERYLTTDGTYTDTVMAINGCDSIITLYLKTRDRIPVSHNIVHIPDTMAPYQWKHIWRENDGTYRDSTRTLIASGGYEYRTLNKFGCDSIDSLTLVIHQTYNILLDTITICYEQTPYAWEDVTEIRTSDFYTYKTLTHDGYDSIRTVYINVLPTERIIVYDTLCDGDSLRFGLTKLNLPRFLTKSGVYYDTLTSEVYGCDSIIELRLNVFPKYFEEHTAHISVADTPYVWSHIQGGDTIANDTIHLSGGQTEGYSYTFTTAFGCDSVDFLTLHVHQTYLYRDTVTICASETPYEWEGIKDIYTTNEYVKNLRTHDGYDSTLIRYVVVLPVINNTLIIDTICEGDSLRFGLTKLNQPRFLDATGVYYDTLQSVQYGCDSIIELRLNVYPKYRRHQQVDIADTELPYNWEHIQGGNLIDTDVLNGTGEYVYRFTTAYGCDSIDSLSLRVHQTYNIKDDTIDICSDATPYTWHTYNNITSSGAYTFYGQTADGYDSIHTVYINVWPVKDTTIYWTMCEGTEYAFGDTLLTTQGTYKRTLISRSTGCDSIVTLILYVQPMVVQTNTTTIFEGDSAFFFGEWYKESGIYTHKEKINDTECYDIYQLILTVLPSITIDTVANVCENELPFIWRGKEYNEPKQYSQAVSWSDTSRVVMRLTLNVLPVPRMERIKELCEGDIFSYKNKLFDRDTVFNDTILSDLGCDSIIRYIVRVHPVYDRTFERHISDKDTVMFHGEVLRSEGNYEWTGKAAYGCDSMEHLILHVHPSYFFLDSIEICEPDTFEWHGQHITKAGLYYDSLVTKQYNYRFDSVYHLIVKTHPYYVFNEKYEIGDGEILKLHGRDISNPGEYWDTLYTTHGCDSIFHVIVNKRHTLEFSSTLQLCQSETPYRWHNMTLTRSGSYTYTSQYKDSIVHLDLTVYPLSISETRVLITDVQAENGYIFGGKLYNDLPSVGKKIYADTLTNQYGCDSIARLAIVVTKRYSEWIPIPLCPGGELTIDGQLITKAGLYTFERRSKATGEMDSLYRVEVYNAPAYDFPVERRVICDGDTTFFAGKAITRGGRYDFPLKTKEGCDSILHLDLTVNPIYHYYVYATTPDYQPYNWYGRSYIQTGIYERTWPTINDCDSTYTLELTVIPTQRDTMTETICIGQAFNWRGKQYEVDGYYTDTVWSPETNFSAIYALRLIVAYPTTITKARTGDVCADAETFDIYFEYDGEKPTHYSVFFDQLAKREGFKDVIDEPFNADMVAHVSLPQFANVAYQGHPYYVRPDYYTMRIALDNGVCGIYRSDTISLLVKYPNWILEQNWDDVVAVLKADYNGGYEFAQTDWYVNGVLTSSNLGYLQSKDLLVGDQVVMLATRKGETVAIPTCPLTIHTPAATTYDTPVIVYPTQTPKQLPVITVEAPRDGRFEIYSSTGLLVGSGKLEEGKTTLTLPSVNGIYFIRAHQGNEASTHKVILY